MIRLFTLFSLLMLALLAMTACAQRGAAPTLSGVRPTFVYFYTDN